MKEFIPLLVFLVVVIFVFGLASHRILKKVRMRDAKRLRVRLAELKSDAELAEKEGNKLEAVRLRREIMKLTEKFKNSLLSVPEATS